jgi:integrase
VKSYAEKHLRNLRSAVTIERRLRSNVLPVIGTMRLAELHRRDINRVIDPIIARGCRPLAAQVFEIVRAMLGWAVARGDLDHSPIAGMTKPDGSKPRERVLGDEELHTLWNMLPTVLPRSPAIRRILRLCLVTGQRVGEVSGIRLDEIDRKLWRLPASRSKNKHPHTVPLSDLALSLIDEAIADARNGYLFPSGEGSLLPATVARAVGRAQELFGLPHWTPHDLRRTVVTNMQRLGVQPIVIGHVVNHRSITKAGVTLGIYGQYSYDAEKRQALDHWADHLQAIIAGDSEKVVPMVRPNRDGHFPKRL